MWKLFISFCLALVVSMTAQNAGADSDIYYARCNLKILKGSLITWVNWQAAPEVLPVGTKVKLTLQGKRANVTVVDTTRKLTLDMGAAGVKFLEKFFIKTPVDLKQTSEDVLSNINAALARVGMSKKEAYIAMGPPAWVTKGNTNSLTYEDIMNSESWVYKRRRFGKNIGLQFDHTSGNIIRTEGIWR